MAIKKSRTKAEQPNFDDMMSEVEEELEVQQAEQDIVDRVPQLKQLGTDIDKATTAVINAKLSLESSIQFTKREEGVLGAAVKTISEKVDTINTHIDNVLKDAPSKLQVSVKVADADWKKIQEKFNEEHKWMLTKMQEHIREVNAMFVQERKNVRDRYKEYDGCYLGHYAQWFFWFFFVLGFFMFTAVIVMLVGKWLNWF